ncbi:MAG: hypothetical protein K2G70_04440, partial [Turicibacter sp.]|nr:hypothetical protein [Turicibacter sp.]
HYGIPKRSGRFPWGSGKRPFQSGGGPIGSVVRSVRNKKAIKQRNENLKKAREKAAENRRLAADKERVLRSGSAREVSRYKGKLTNQELSDAVRRLELESKLDDFSKKEITTKMDKVKAVMKTVNDVSDFTKTGTKVYNQMADIYNATPNGRRNPLPKIGQQTPQPRDERR